MPHSFVNNPENGYIRVNFSGEVDVREAAAALQNMLFLLEETGMKRILADSKNIGPSFTTSEVYSFMMGLSEVLPKGLKIAINGKPQRTRLGDFVETISVNRAINLRYFTSEKEAIEWLMS